MKYDIALHELMRLDEYAEEENKAKAQHNANPNQTVAKDGELTATDTAEAPTMSESPSSIDIPSATVINYDEPPAITEADALVAINDEAVIAPAEAPEQTSGAEPVLDLDRATELAIDPGESLTDPEDLPTTEETIAAVRSTTDTAKETAIDAAESTTAAAKETANNTVEALASATESVKETASDAVEAVKSTTDAAQETVMNAVESTTDAAKETFETIQAEAPGVFEEVTSAVPAFFNQNRQLLINLGLIFLAFVVTKLAFAGINAIDDLPLVTPLLKVVGLFYVVKFIWNYLLREQDREKLVAKFNKTKAEVLGDRS